ncbi:DUF411 domain-containing protein [Morganella psychrotolerans]|uniref:DUF411 domain-containing protein n=1 Tax=Morganella psychrotolerans TaxID=368603 RepID=UPI000B228669|nr:DUF411 domain-containing protein [Morganella psychrotolerans]
MNKSVLALALFTTLSAGAMAAKGTVTVYKSPTCGCCGQWADGVEKAGYDVQTNIVPQAQLEKMMIDSGASMNLMSCHLATLNGKYVIGHVPADSWMLLIPCRKRQKEFQYRACRPAASVWNIKT